MVKQDIVTALASKTGLTRVQSLNVLDVLLEVTSKALKKGEEIQIRGWGAFKTVTRKARMGRNPQTGQAISIPAKKAVKFTPSKHIF